MAGRNRKREEVLVSPKLMPLGVSSSQVVQSRGVCNKLTEYHERIVELVERNAELIRSRMVA